MSRGVRLISDICAFILESFVLNNMERIPERQLQLLILPLQRELRRVKQEAVKKANLEKAKIEFQQPAIKQWSGILANKTEDLDALAMGVTSV